MKKFLLLFAVALMVAACNGQGDKKQEQGDDKKVIVPPGMPIAPTPQIPPSTNPTSNPNTSGSGSNTPVLKLEEGKPLDFSQLMGERKTLQEQATERIDSIRYQAEQGNADYQYMFGLCLENGWGVDENPQQAAIWYKKAADQQQKASYNALGNMYRTGKGVKHNDKEAFDWFKKGAEADDAQAMLNLGNCYYFGMGTEKSLEEAVRWWQNAADGDNAYATAQMGDCYFNGIGVEKNLEKAIEYYTIAAGRNMAGAQYRLGVMYYSGEGVKQDLAYSKMLMSKARDGGMKEAQDFLDKYFKE